MFNFSYNNTMVEFFKAFVSLTISVQPLDSMLRFICEALLIVHII